MRNFLILAATLLAVSAVSAFAAEPCQLKLYGVIPFETGEGGHISLPATLGGQSTRLELDTGAFWSVINGDLAKSLNLTLQPSTYIEMRDLAGAKIDKIARVPEVKVGNLSFGAADFFVSGSAVGSIERDGGLLGQNLLTQVDLEIDNAAKTISLFSQDHCPGDGVHWADEAVTLQYRRAASGLSSDDSGSGASYGGGTRFRQKIDKNQIDPPIVTAEVEGAPLAILFDTGSTYTAMDLGMARRRFHLEPGSPGVQPAGKIYAVSGEAIDSYSYTFKSLTIAGIKFENVPVTLADFHNNAQMILGMNEMKHLHLYFSFKEGLIYITAADAKRTPK